MSGAACGQVNGREGGEGRMCACCGVEVGAKVCSGCHSVYYCGAACQKSHWSGGHKKECAELGKAYAHEKNEAADKKLMEGRYEGARKQLEKSVQVQREHTSREGSGSAELGRTLTQMGSVFFAEGKYEEALEKLMEGLQISRKEVGDDHGDVAMPLLSIGHSYIRLRKPQLALPKFEEALPTLLRLYGHLDPSVLGAYAGLGQAHFLLGEYDKALENYEKLFEIQLAAYGWDLFTVACSLVTMGNILKAHGEETGREGEGRSSKFKLALRKYEDALQLKLQVLGPEHQELGTLYHNMGCVCIELRLHDKALGYLDKALPIHLKALGSEHIDVARTQHLRARVYHAQGSYGRAKELLEGCVKVFSRVYGADHIQTKNIIKDVRSAEARLRE